MSSSRSGRRVAEYEARVASEIDIYRDCTDVHDLPPIFHYWSNRYIRPMLEPCGFKDPAGMFLRALENQCAKHAGSAAPLRFLSAGSGNCELEARLAAGLHAKGYTDFTIECVDLNPAMLKRGAENAKQRGVAGNLEFVEADLNRWVAHRGYHAAMADQSLHHVMELEWLFGQIRRSLRPDGVFVISDMIGRNGHRRWPAALAIVHEFWKKLPPSYRYNCRSERYEAVFGDSDCSTESFEGIRAQDIVGLLAEFFHFQFFLGFGNVIDPFVDRCFGPHFDPQAAWDREFIDRVHRRDAEEIAAGRLQPTHMLAVLGTQRITGLTLPAVPVSAARTGIAIAQPLRSAYEWGSWPHPAESQLRRVCRIAEESDNRLKALEEELGRAVAGAQRLDLDFQRRTAWAMQLDRQLQEATLACRRQEEELAVRTEWARGLERELAERTAWCRKLDTELKERTAWARRLEAELDERTAWARRLEVELLDQTVWARRLDAELADRTAWALRLETQLSERTAWALRLETELAERRRTDWFNRGLSGCLRAPLRFAKWLLAGWWNASRKNTEARF